MEIPGAGFVLCCSFAAMNPIVEKTERMRIMTLLLGLRLRLMMLLVCLIGIRCLERGWVLNERKAGGFIIGEGDH